MATSMTVSTSSHAAGAAPIRLAFILRYEMQCGYPGAGPLVVTFPAALKLPQQFAAGAVRLAGKRMAAAVDGHRVTVSIPPYKGTLCDLMGRGALTLVFTRGAKLANPARAGSYHFQASHLRRTFSASFAIKST